MGVMVNGAWRVGSFTTDEKGAFKRAETSFHDWITPDGASGFKAAPGRYHLYVSLACPWAHRTLIFRKLKKLEDAVSVSIVDHFMGEDGWAFSDNPGCIPDSVNGAKYLREIYLTAKPGYTGRVTVPALWDKERGTIVNNESAEIIRMFNSAFDAFGDAALDFYPEDLREEIDAINAPIYENVNNGVYRAGFATHQASHEDAVTTLFATLDGLEERLGHQRYLCGARVTEADWRLFTTLLRFDPVYHGHFKCNLRRLIDYPNLWGYTRELYQTSGVAETCNFDHIKRHYYESHETVNPTRIVPVGRLRRRRARFLPGRPARRDRRHQRADLRERQQRRLSGWLRHAPGVPRRRGNDAIRHPRRPGGTIGPPALSVWRAGHRGRLAPVHHALALRPGLPWPLQVQPKAPHRLPQPVGLYARALPDVGRRRDVQLRPHKTTLLREPRDRESDAHRARGPDHRLHLAPRPRPLPQGCVRKHAIPEVPPCAGHPDGGQGRPDA